MRAAFILNTAGVIFIVLGWIWGVTLDAETGTPTGYLVGVMISVGVVLIAMGIALVWWREG